jgi:hypothetical protein
MRAIVRVEPPDNSGPAGWPPEDPFRVAGPDAGSRLQFTIWVEDSATTVVDRKARGATLLNGSIDRPWDQRITAFADPAGHIREITQSIVG